MKLINVINYFTNNFINDLGLLLFYHFNYFDFVFLRNIDQIKN